MATLGNRALYQSSRIPSAHLFLYIQVSSSLGFQRSKSVLCHLHCKAMCSLKRQKQLGNNVPLNANETISQTSKQQVGNRFTFHVSKKIFECKKLIKMIISTYFLCQRSNFKTSCFSNHQVTTQKQYKTWPVALCFRMFSPIWKPD